MKKPTPAEAPVAPLMPHSGGSWVREKDGTLRLEEATDSTPEARAAALEATLEAPVQSPVETRLNDPVKEA